MVRNNDHSILDNDNKAELSEEIKFYMRKKLGIKQKSKIFDDVLTGSANAGSAKVGSAKPENKDSVE
jgi:hypothetical protein